MFWVERKLRRKCILANLPKKKLLYIFLRRQLCIFVIHFLLWSSWTCFAQTFQNNLPSGYCQNCNTYTPKMKAGECHGTGSKYEEQRHLQTGCVCTPISQGWKSPAPLTPPTVFRKRRGILKLQFVFTQARSSPQAQRDTKMSEWLQRSVFHIFSWKLPPWEMEDQWGL